MKIGLNIIGAVSAAIYLANAKAKNPAAPFKQLYKQNMMKEYLAFEQEKLPSLMFTIFNGGKDLQSKVKFSKFFLILKPSLKTNLNLHEVYLRFVENLDKALSAQKVGLQSFKKGALDGSYFNAFDTIAESFKVLEDVITGLGVNSEEKILKLGINTDAQNWFLTEQGLYDFDGSGKTLLKAE